MGQRILLCGNTAWGMFNFRQGLLKALLAQGNEVTVVAPKDDSSQKLTDLGCDVRDIKISAKGVNPFKDLALLFSLAKNYRDLKPDFVFHYTIKPNIYGSMAARLAGIPSIAVTTGLGHTFENTGFIASVARMLYKVSFRSPKQVWFLNQDDMDAFLNANLVAAEKVFLLDSEGVDIEHFKPMGRPAKDGKTRYLLLARMLWEKGVGEFVQSARKIREKHPDAIFQLLGDADVKNPSAIGRKQITDWEREGVIEYLGVTSDVRPIINEADCVVLPSFYREGVPRTLLEAASMEKPIVTTDSVGCREAVIPNETGWQCEPKSVKSLTESLEKFLALPEKHREEMGKAARRYVVHRFDEKKIIEKYFDAIG